MNWVRTNAVAIVALAVVAWLAFALVRALVIALRRRAEPGAAEVFSRTEKVRADIRRKIAARKHAGNVPPPSAPPVEAAAPARRLRPLDPFGGPGRRWWTWLRGRRRRYDERSP